MNDVLKKILICCVAISLYGAEGEDDVTQVLARVQGRRHADERLRALVDVNNDKAKNLLLCTLAIFSNTPESECQDLPSSVNLVLLQGFCNKRKNCLVTADYDGDYPIVGEGMKLPFSSSPALIKDRIHIARRVAANRATKRLNNYQKRRRT